MTKKVLATNCKITNLPKGWTAKIDDKGSVIIIPPTNMEGMFGGTIIAKSLNLNGFTAITFDGENPIKLTGDCSSVNESDFHDM
jgi:hypothetical protein